MEISHADQNLILMTASGLPPVSWLRRCYTLDQKSHWELVRSSFQDIYKQLRCYFQGEQSPKLPNSHGYQDICTTGVARYISLYNLIFWAFQEIQSLSESLNLTIPKTPGFYLCRILELECEALFNQCQGYTELYPRQIYDLSREGKKIRQLKEKQQLTVKELNQIKRFESKAAKFKAKFQDFDSLTILAVGVASASHNSRVKTAYHHYQDICDQLDQAIMKAIHPSKRIKGHTWNKGMLNNLSQ
jgi:hypothetical protein